MLGCTANGLPILGSIAGYGMKGSLGAGRSESMPGEKGGEHKGRMGFISVCVKKRLLVCSPKDPL
jgi:hypothetical protein